MIKLKILYNINQKINKSREYILDNIEKSGLHY